MLAQERQNNMLALPFQDLANVVDWRTKRQLPSGEGKENMGLGWGQMDGLVSRVEKVEASGEGEESRQSSCWNSDDSWGVSSWDNSCLLGRELLEDIKCGQKQQLSSPAIAARHSSSLAEQLAAVAVVAAACPAAAAASVTTRGVDQTCWTVSYCRVRRRSL